MCIRFIHGAAKVIGVEGHGYTKGEELQSLPLQKAGASRK